MDDDGFGDLYIDVLKPFKPPAGPQSSPPPSPPHPPIDISFRSRDYYFFSRDGRGGGASSIALEKEPPKSPFSPSPDAICTADCGKDVKFDTGEGDTYPEPVIPGLSVAASAAEPLSGLATDQEIAQSSAKVDKGSDGITGEEGPDWDSDSEDDLQIVLNDSIRSGMVEAEGRPRMGNNEEDDDDDDDDEEPLVIVADIDPNQALDEQLWGEDGLQATEGEGKDAAEAGKASGVGAAAAPKIGYSSHGYHPFHSQFKYVRPGAAPMPGGIVSGSGVPSGQVRPAINIGPITCRGRGDWNPLGMKSASAIQKGFHQGLGAPWGSNTAGRGFGVGLDFTLPSHKTIFEVDIDGFEEKPWRYPGVDITDFFNFGLNEGTWKEYCKLLEQHRIETTMQSRIRVYESGRTDQGYDPDLPPELAAATGAQGASGDSSIHLKSDIGQGNSAKGPAHIRPPLPPGRPIPVESGSGERLPSMDTRAPRIRDTDAIIEIICQVCHRGESSAGNGVDEVGNSLPRENFPADKGCVNDGRADTGSPPQAPTPDEPGDRLLGKHEGDKSESTDGRHSLPSSSTVDDRDTRSATADHKDAVAEASKGSEMVEHKMRSAVPQSVMQDEDGGESKTERSSESSKARSGIRRDYQQLKDSAEEEVIQDKRYAHTASNRKHLDENSQHHRRKSHDTRQEIKQNHVAVRGGRDNSCPHTDIDPRYTPHSYMIAKDFDQRKERDLDSGVWCRRDDDAYSRRNGDEVSRKKDHGDDMGSRHRGKMRESEPRSKDDHVPSRKQLDDGGLRVQSDRDFGSRHKEKDESLRSNYEVADDSRSKRRKDEEYLRRGRSDKNENSHGQRESIYRLKWGREDTLEHQKRDVRPKMRDDFDDHHCLWHRDEFYVQRDGTERKREREERDNLKEIREKDLSVWGRERQAVPRSQRASEDRISRTKDEYKASDKEYTSRHGKRQKRRENASEGSSSHHRRHEDASARSNQIVNNEKKSRQERDTTKNDMAIDSSDSQRLPEKRHKESRRKHREPGIGDTMNLGQPRSQQDEQNGNIDEMAFKGTLEPRISRNEIVLQPKSTRKHKDDASSDEDQQDSRRGRSKLERWTSHKERDYTLQTKSSVSPPFHGVDKSTNGGSRETGKPAHDTTGEQGAVTEEQGASDAVDIKESCQKDAGERHLDTVEKLKKRSERFKLPMPNDKDGSTIKKRESEVLQSAKEGPAESGVKPERPARKRRWTSS